MIQYLEQNILPIYLYCNDPVINNATDSRDVKNTEISKVFTFSDKFDLQSKCFSINHQSVNFIITKCSHLRAFKISSLSQFSQLSAINFSLDYFDSEKTRGFHRMKKKEHTTTLNS